MIERTPEQAQMEIGRAAEYLKWRKEHREYQRDTILDYLCGLLLFGFGVFSGIALMGGL